MKILIDCGFHKGLYTREHIDDFDRIYGFECNPALAKYGENWPDKVTWYNSAVWIDYCTKKFYFSTREDGATLCEHKKNLTGESVEVKCMNFPEWIVKVGNKTDFIRVKMDIEGAEFPVLGKMILDNSIKWVNELYVEWHCRQLARGRAASRVNRIHLINEMELMGVAVHNWK